MDVENKQERTRKQLAIHYYTSEKVARIFDFHTCSQHHYLICDGRIGTGCQQTLDNAFVCFRRSGVQRCFVSRVRFVNIRPEGHETQGHRHVALVGGGVQRRGTNLVANIRVGLGGEQQARNLCMASERRGEQGGPAVGILHTQPTIIAQIIHTYTLNIMI